MKKKAYDFIEAGQDETLNINMKMNEVAILLKWDEGDFYGMEVYEGTDANPMLVLFARMIGEMTEGEEYEDIWQRLANGARARAAAQDKMLDVRYEN